MMSFVYKTSEIYLLGQAFKHAFKSLRIHIVSLNNINLTNIELVTYSSGLNQIKTAYLSY